MKVDPRIFREYDVRGVAGTQFDQKTVDEYEKWYGKFTGVSIDLNVSEAIGKAYGTMISRAGGKKVIIGFEQRPYGEELTKAFIDGVLSTGVDVDYAGVALTPLIYFATAFYGYDGGVNVTGSHNVYFFNGFKMMKKDVYPLYGEELQRLKSLVETDDFVASDPGVMKDKNIFDDYKQYLKKRFGLKRKIKIVIDSGNGSAGVFAPTLFRELGCEVIDLYSEPDATFPNHVPDPEMPQNTVALMEAVRQEEADLGIGFDADGDRAGFIDERGEMVVADDVLLVLAKDLLPRFPGGKILFDVKCSEVLVEELPKMNGIPLMHVTGHAPIKASLRKDHQIVLGAEVSGHFYFVDDYFRIDDGTMAAARVLSLFDRTGGKFSDLFANIPRRIRTPEIKLPCPDELKFKLVQKISETLKGSYRSILIDGIRFYLNARAWALLRASNTSPYLTLRFEAEDRETLLRLKNLVADELEKFEEVGDKLNRSEICTLTGKLGWL